MGLLSWLQRKSEPVAHVEVEDKVYEGFRFPKEAEVEVVPGVRGDQNYWTWLVQIGRTKHSGRKPTKESALGAAERAARELAQRHREREAHLAQEKIQL